MHGILDDAKNYLTTFVDQQINPVYNAQGRYIGYYDDLLSLSQGKWKKFAGEPDIDFSTMQIKCGVLALLGNATECLLKKGYTPVWLTAEQKAQVIAKVQAAMPDINALVSPAVTINKMPLYIAGGAAFLGLALILTRPR